MNDIDLEMLGISISQQCEWNGYQILKVCMAALTDANFHSESEIVEQMLAAVESMDDTPEYKLTVLNAPAPSTAILLSDEPTPVEPKPAPPTGGFGISEKS